MEIAANKFHLHKNHREHHQTQPNEIAVDINRFTVINKQMDSLTSLSSLPGLRRAGSRWAGLFVAATTITGRLELCI